MLLKFAIVTALPLMADDPGVAAAQAKTGTQILDQVTACRSLADPTQRLACFDRSIETLSTAQARGEVTMVDREEIRRTRRSLFGLSLPRIPLLDGRDDDARVQEKELESTITRASANSQNGWTLVLADGSVWQTTEPARSRDPKAGDAIRIRAAALGSYLANIGGGRGIRVRRIS